MRQKRIEPQHEFRIAPRELQIAQKQIVFAQFAIFLSRGPFCRIELKRQAQCARQLIGFLRLQIVSSRQMANQRQNIRRKLIPDGFQRAIIPPL